jgi:hypothetical protein
MAEAGGARVADPDVVAGVGEDKGERLVWPIQDPDISALFNFFSPENKILLLHKWE